MKRLLLNTLLSEISPFAPRKRQPSTTLVQSKLFLGLSSRQISSWSLRAATNRRYSVTADKNSITEMQCLQGSQSTRKIQEKQSNHRNYAKFILNNAHLGDCAIPIANKVEFLRMIHHQNFFPPLHSTIMRINRTPSETLFVLGQVERVSLWAAMIPSSKRSTVLDCMQRHVNDDKFSRLTRDLEETHPFLDQELASGLRSSEIGKNGCVAYPLLWRLNAHIYEDSAYAMPYISPLVIGHVGSLAASQSDHDGIDKLGNLILLTKAFREKKHSYVNQLPLTKEVSQLREWNDTSFQKQHNRLLHLAFKAFDIRKI